LDHHELIAIGTNHGKSAVLRFRKQLNLCSEFWLIYSFSLGILIVLYCDGYISIFGSRYQAMLTKEFLTLIETIDMCYWFQ